MSDTNIHTPTTTQVLQAADVANQCLQSAKVLDGAGLSASADLLVDAAEEISMLIKALIGGTDKATGEPS